MRGYKYILALLATCAFFSCERCPDRQVFEGSGLGAPSKYYELSDSQTDTLIDVIATMQYDIRHNADWIATPATSQGRDGFMLTCQENKGLKRLTTIILAIDQTNHYDTLTICQNGTKAIKTLKGTESGVATIALNSEIMSHELNVRYYGEVSNWIEGTEIVDNNITFTYQKNDNTTPRLASIMISYTDSEGRVLEHGFDILQLNNQDNHIPVNGPVVDLTADGKWANCYILNENSATNYSIEAKHVSGKLISKGIRVAEILWETAEGTVKNPVFDPIDNKLYFEKEAGAKGNAIIALKDNNNTIIWSFHIWVPGEEMKDVVIGGVTFMDRNLGANTSSAPSSNENSSVGMHYQWGRKDPFPPAKNLSTANGIQSEVFPSDAITYTPANEGHSGKPLSFAIENPATYIWGSGSTGIEDWSAIQNDNYWSSIQKTNYDPCPYGYIVPSKDQLLAVTSRWKSSKDATKGKNITCDDNTTNYWVKAGWYRRSYNATSQLANVGNHGYYWTSTEGAYSASVRGAYVSQSQDIQIFVRRWGGNVRCVKIK